jgi:HSP20 family protein
MTDKKITHATHYLRPRSQITESREGRLRVVLEMPGVRKDGLQIKIENNELQILGRREPPAERKYILRERPSGDYVQTYTLDETVDSSKIDAVLEKGILTLSLELKEHVKPRVIQVRGE